MSTGNANVNANPWLSDPTIALPIGQRVLHMGLVAFVRGVSMRRGEPSNVTIEYHEMYKPDPSTNGTTLKQCHIDPTGVTTSHPCANH
jgi:hypothetical protein